MSSGAIERLAFSPSEAAEALNVSRAHIYNMLARGELRAIKLGRATRIPASVLAELLGGGAHEATV